MDPRQEGLLKWAVENSDPQSQLSEEHLRANLSALSPEWYDAVFGKSDIDIMREMLSILQTYLDNDKHEVSPTTENIVNILEELCFFVELTHNANDLCSIGGLPVLIALLGIDQEPVRYHAVWIIAEASGNNYQFESSLRQHFGIIPITQLLVGDPSIRVRAKALHALSTLVKLSSSSLEVFLQNVSIGSLSLLLEENDRNIRRRVVFLVDYLLQQPTYEDIASAICLGDFLDRIIGHLTSTVDMDFTEKAVSLISTYVQLGLKYKDHAQALHIQALLGSLISNFVDNAELVESIETLLNKIK